MIELFKYMTSGFWVFVASMMILSLFLTFILSFFKRLLWTKREYIGENERLRAKIKLLTEKLEEKTK